MTKIKLSSFQIYAMLILYCLGSSSILFLARDAGQDAWISVIIGGVISTFNFVFIYGSIYKLNKDEPTYIDTINHLFGNVLGRILLFLYACYYSFLSFFILRDIIEITGLYILNRTPRMVILVFEILLVYYGLQKGIETLFRTAELYFFAVIISYILVIFFLSFSDVVNFQYLFPILENGIKPVIKATPVLFLTFPFGALAIFLYLFPLVQNKKGVKVGALALITVGLIMLLVTIFVISTLGPYLAYNNTFPVVVMIRLINVGNFIQRLDAIVILVFLSGSIFQILLLLRVTTKSLQFALNINNKQWIIIPLCIILYFGTDMIGQSRREYFHFGTKILPYYIGSIFEVGLPLIILIVSIIKYFKKKKNTKKSRIH